MPLVKPQELKSLNTIALQPDKITSKIEMIMLLDIAGKGTCEIAEHMGMTPGRISIIKGTPIYIQQRDVEKSKLQAQFRTAQVDKIVGDPVDALLKQHAINAARKKIDLMENGKSEFVQLAAAGDVLDRAGYKAHQEKTTTSIEITEKMADRFEKALKFTVEVTK